MNQQPPPGYEQRKHIREVVPELSRQMRTAFAAGCAERVLPVLDDYFSRDGELFRRAIDLAWRYALGESGIEGQIQQAIDACEKLVDVLYDNDDAASATLYALNAISFTLQSTTQVESKLVYDAVSDAGGAAQSGDSQHGDEHIQEESEWQVQALDVARAAAKPSRDMFQHLPANPRWLQLFRARRRA